MRGSLAWTRKGQKMSENDRDFMHVVTSVMVRESFMFAQLSATGRDTNEAGTAFTVAKSKAFDAWLESVKREAGNENR